LSCQNYEFFINFVTTANIYIYSNNLQKSRVTKAKTTLNIQYMS